MKTFDIAIKYLEIIYFSGVNMYAPRGAKAVPDSLMATIQNALSKYEADHENVLSNDYYRSMIFEAALHHLWDKQKNGTSWWDKAIEIVQANKEILKTKYEGFTPKSIYPKVMMDAFLKYCNERNPQPTFLGEKSDVRVEFFMSAFHYIIDDKC